MLSLADIRQVQIELTTRCNARCPMCMRNYRGMDHNSGYPVTELTLENIKQILTPEFLSQLYKGVLFNGNLGDFGLARDGVEIVEYIASHSVRQQINTNGSMHNSSWWARLALPGVRIGFAIDGLADTHHLYRQDTNWHTVIQNARAFIEAGGEAWWRFVPFEHNRHQEQACRDLAKQLGFSHFENIYDGREKGPVFTRTGKFSHWLGVPTKQEQITTPNIDALLKSHVTWFDSKTVRLDKDKTPHNIRCQHEGQEEIYIAADGSVWPCCYLGFYPGSMQHPGNEQLLPLVRENNALEYELAHCLKWFANIEETWTRDSIADGRLYQCVNHCADRAHIKLHQTKLTGNLF